jgi:hypothetical protein
MDNIIVNEGAPKRASKQVPEGPPKVVLGARKRLQDSSGPSLTIILTMTCAAMIDPK